MPERDDPPEPPYGGLGRNPPEPDRAELGVRFGELHVHVHHHGIPPGGQGPASDQGQILALLQKVLSQMSKTSDALADLSAADTELSDEVQLLLTDVEGFPAQLTAAVQKALADAGDADDANAAAIEAATTSANDLVARIKAAITPTPPAPEGMTIAPTAITGTAGQALTGAFEVTGGAAPFTFAAENNPPDILVGTDGTISGTPAAAEAGDFHVVVTDSTGATADVDVSYAIAAAQ